MNIKGLLVSGLAVILVIAGVSGFVLAGSSLDNQTYEQIQRGEKIFRKCKACHSFKKNGLGPNLSGIVMRPFASAKGFRYSSALRERQDFTWTVDNLDAFLADPHSFIPGNRMRFKGIKKKEDRESLIEYLKNVS